MENGRAREAAFLKLPALAPERSPGGRFLRYPCAYPPLQGGNSAEGRAGAAILFAAVAGDAAARLLRRPARRAGARREPRAPREEAGREGRGGGRRRGRQAPGAAAEAAATEEEVDPAGSGLAPSPAAERRWRILTSSTSTASSNGCWRVRRGGGGSGEEGVRCAGGRPGAAGWGRDLRPPLEMGATPQFGPLQLGSQEGQDPPHDALHSSGGGGGLKMYPPRYTPHRHPPHHRPPPLLFPPRKPGFPSHDLGGSLWSWGGSEALWTKESWEMGGRGREGDPLHFKEGLLGGVQSCWGETLGKEGDTCVWFECSLVYLGGCLSLMCFSLPPLSIIRDEF